MSTKKVIEGMSILLSYYNNPDGFNVAAEHDVIYMYRTDKSLSNEDLNKMIELGWFQENCTSYDPNEGWQRFV